MQVEPVTTTPTLKPEDKHRKWQSLAAAKEISMDPAV